MVIARFPRGNEVDGEIISEKLTNQRPRQRVCPHFRHQNELAWTLRPRTRIRQRRSLSFSSRPRTFFSLDRPAWLGEQPVVPTFPTTQGGSTDASKKDETLAKVCCVFLGEGTRERELQRGRDATTRICRACRHGPDTTRSELCCQGEFY